MVKITSLLCLILLINLSHNHNIFKLSDECYTSLVDSQSCEWYTKCLEQKYQCGAKGYPLGYGHKYCMKFGQLKSYPAVEKWVQDTTICLKQKLIPLLNTDRRLSCKQIKKEAFKSHPVCYDKSGFCKLVKKLGPIKYLVFLK